MMEMIWKIQPTCVGIVTKMFKGKKLQNPLKLKANITVYIKGNEFPSKKQKLKLGFSHNKKPKCSDWVYAKAAEMLMLRNN